MGSRATRLVLATLSWCVGVGSASGAKRWTKVVPAAGKSAVSIKVVVAAVRVVSSRREEIRIEAQGENEPKVSAQGTSVRIKWRPQGEADSEKPRTLTVHLPGRLAVQVKSVSGAVTARNLGAALKIKTVSGAVQATACRGPLRLKSVSGAVTVERASAEKISVKAVSGAVMVEGARLGEVRARTASGEIEARAGTARSLRLGSASGSITVGVRHPRGGEVKARSLSGEVTVHWPSGSGFVLDARTMSGELKNGFKLAGATPAAKWVQGLVGKSARGTVGSGGTKLRLRTISGDLRILAR